VPAQASLDLLARITKEKDIKVTQTVEIEKNILIAVRLDEQYAGAAEADSVSNQLNTGNDVRGNISDQVPGFAPSYGINRTALIQRSINSNSGMVGVNQDSGNMVNQGNVVAVALTTNPATGPVLPGGTGQIGSVANSQAEADQINTNNNLLQLERTIIQNGEILTPPDMRADIEDSINGNSGAIGVNQNVGSMNNQLNKLAIAIGPGAKVALSEAALGQVNSGNRSEEIGTHRHAEIRGSVNNNSGIVAVNQSGGSMNNQASVVSMAVLTSRVAITTP